MVRELFKDALGQVPVEAYGHGHTEAGYNKGEQGRSPSEGHCLGKGKRTEENTKLVGMAIPGWGRFARGYLPRFSLSLPRALRCSLETCI